MVAPIHDPYASIDRRDPSVARPSAGGRAFRAALLVMAVLSLAALGAGALLVGLRGLSPAPAGGVTARPSPATLLAVRDLARLETTEVHVEKVVDLTDRQSRFFGLVETTDALLLVAVGRVTIGVDLSRLTESDIALDPETGAARLSLPEPEIFSSRLDEEQTYVYTRATSLLAKRNEHLENRARKEAVQAIEKAAFEGDVMARAKAQAERTISALATRLGAQRLEVRWRPAGGG